MIKPLRKIWFNPSSSMLKALLMLEDPTAQAYVRMSDMCKKMNGAVEEKQNYYITVEKLIETTLTVYRRRLLKLPIRFLKVSMSFKNFVKKKDIFWEDIGLLTGITIHTSFRKNFMVHTYSGDHYAFV